MAILVYLLHEQVDRWLQMLEKCQANLADMVDKAVDKAVNKAIDRAFRAHLAPPQTSPPAHLAQPAPAAPQPCTQPTPPELPPQPITAPVPARSYPPSPSVKTIEEVEQKQVYKPLRNVKQMRQKSGAAIPRIRVAKFFEDCLGWPAKFGGINMCFSRDEEPDAWYTTMLNHKRKLAIGAMPNPA